MILVYRYKPYYCWEYEEKMHAQLVFVNQCKMDSWNMILCYTNTSVGSMRRCMQQLVILNQCKMDSWDMILVYKHKRWEYEKMYVASSDFESVYLHRCHFLPSLDVVIIYFSLQYEVQHSCE